MSGTGTEGNTQASRSLPLSTSYMPNGDPGPYGGGTYTGYPTEPSIRDYENVFGPSARDIKDDLQKYKRHGRWHLPDILKGPNPWLTDRIDGLITDATNSPFTSIILPYKYFDNVDGKIKWNVWSFDEAMASRVPYEAAARTLTQSKRSFAGYAVRHGLAINLEHNFMMTPHGRENFQNQLKQLIGSIQYSNDLDVHMALILAPSYEKTMSEKYFGQSKTSGQICREFVDLFGFMQKNQNALDILIEESKIRLKTWGGPMPDFLLCNSKLGFQLQMVPERTNYLTQGPDGVKRLKQGPDLQSYRGLKIVHTRAFSLETGLEPRDMLRRRVRVAEYYRIAPSEHNYKREFEFYNEARDNWFSLTFFELLNMARVHKGKYTDSLPGNNNAKLIDDLLTVHANIHGSGMARPFMGSQLRGNLIGIGKTMQGGKWRQDLKGLGVKSTVPKLQVVSPFFENQIKNARWVRFLQDAREISSRDTPKKITDYYANRNAVFLQCTDTRGVVFSSSQTTGIFDFETIIPAFEDLLDGSLFDEKAKLAITNRAKMWPPWRGWHSLKKQLSQEQHKQIFDRNDIFELKRSFFRYGVPIPGNEKHDKFFLLPFGAFDEPNNAQHLRTPKEGYLEGEAVVYDIHRFLLFTTEVLDVLFSVGDDQKFFIDSHNEKIIVEMLTILKKIFEEEEEEGRVLFSMDISLKFSQKFCAKYQQHKSHFCQNNLIWTMPDSHSFACYSDGNLCGGFADNKVRMHSKILAKMGKAYHCQLNEDYLIAMQDVYQGLSLQHKSLIQDQEPSFFKTFVNPLAEDVPIDSNMISFFAQILQSRLVGDAFKPDNIDTLYYATAMSRIGKIVQYERKDVSRSKFVAVGKGIVLNPPDAEVQSRGETNMLTEQYMRMYPIGSIDEDSDLLIGFSDSDGGAESGGGGGGASGGGGDGGGGDGGGGDAEAEGENDEDDLDPVEGLDDSRRRPRPSRDDDERTSRRRRGRRSDNPRPGRTHDRGSEIDVMNEIDRLRDEIEELRRGGADGGSSDSMDDTESTHELISNLSKKVEIVVLRPNIEHYMLGIIMGLAGEQLGNTLWGQTELSVYDDSMHGVWGMSYK